MRLPGTVTPALSRRRGRKAGDLLHLDRPAGREKLAKAFEAKYSGIASVSSATGAERVFRASVRNIQQHPRVDVVNSSDAAHFIV